MLNAPQGATEFVARAVNEGNQFTRNQVMANVDIGAELAGLDDAVARLGQSRSFQGLQLESDQIRTLDALDKASSAITAMAAERSIPMYRVSQETGKRERISPGEAGIADVMTALKIGPAQQERIAIALDQTSKAKSPTRESAADVISVDRPGRTSLLGGEDVPIKRMPAGGKNPMQGILKEAAKRGQISEEAAAPFMGAIEGERANPTIRALGSPSDIAAATRVERLERVLGKGAVARGAAYLRKQNPGGPAPRFDDVMNLLEDTYQTKVSKGAVDKKKIINEDELSKTIGRKQSVDTRGEDAAMARLLEGALRPGPDFGSFRAPAVGPSSAVEAPSSPVRAERRRRRLGAIPTAAAVTGGGVLASLLLDNGGEY